MWAFICKANRNKKEAMAAILIATKIELREKNHKEQRGNLHTGKSDIPSRKILIIHIYAKKYSVTV